MKLINYNEKHSCKSFALYKLISKMSQKTKMDKKKRKKKENDKNIKLVLVNCIYNNKFLLLPILLKFSKVLFTFNYTFFAFFFLGSAVDS